ncbi:MAG TPA: L-seryl-tRNA(Sec) selenium transferase [Ktedonobacterales bacterium]|nr:L-seryl-tRNA(Sec) selenium transferase [Ktedonobacterales bacterium]
MPRSSRVKQAPQSATDASGAATSTPATLNAALRALPSVEALRLAVRHEMANQTTQASDASNALITQAARETLAQARLTLRAGGEVPSPGALTADAISRLSMRDQPLLRPVINATGVVINTNLGRAPLSEQAIASVVAVAEGYSTLEYDLAAGERGSRQSHTRALLRELTSAEDALVVNNNAAATLVALTALAAGREVIVSRGELVEIGGGFRVPDVMRQSGARLVEVGTTNRTRLADYAAAITDETAALLSVHPSNFRIVGFTESPALAELADLAHAHGLPLLHDLGSGALLDVAPYGLAHEPTVAESVAAGADVICFSGDKLLGGPQAGIIVGRRELLARIERHPLMRAVRCDKLTLAALEATLRQWRSGVAIERLPIWRMIATPADALQTRATHWMKAIEKWEEALAAGISSEMIAGESTVGGGSTPGETLPTWLCALRLDARQDNRHEANHEPGEIGALASLLRQAKAPLTPVVARVSRDRLLLDPRTVFPGQDDTLLATLRWAIRAFVR